VPSGVKMLHVSLEKVRSAEGVEQTCSAATHWSCKPHLPAVTVSSAVPAPVSVVTCGMSSKLVMLRTNVMDCGGSGCHIMLTSSTIDEGGT
jgi:hypothetical protein